MLAGNNVLIPKVLKRAKRTAGNYAQLFLEDEGTEYQGRFYWAGLAAFAAKQVVDGIEFAESKFDEVVGQARLMSRVTYYYLLKGNFWVFLEITPWMLYWRKFGSDVFFRDVDCRNVNTYNPVILEQMKTMPWSMGENTALRNDLERKMRVLDIRKLNWQMNLTDGKGALVEMTQCVVHARQGQLSALHSTRRRLPGNREQRLRHNLLAMEPGSIRAEAVVAKSMK